MQKSFVETVANETSYRSVNVKNKMKVILLLRKGAKFRSTQTTKRLAINSDVTSYSYSNSLNSFKYAISFKNLQIAEAIIKRIVCTAPTSNTLERFTCAGKICVKKFPGF